MAGAKNNSAMERLVTQALMRGDKGYGVNGSGAGGGKQAKADKNPYGYMDFKDFESTYPKDLEGNKPGLANSYEVYRTVLDQNRDVLGNSDQGHSIAISIAHKFGKGEYKPSAEMMPDGVWGAQIQHGAAFYNLQQGINPIGNHGVNALQAPPREKVIQMDRQWLENLGQSEEGREIYQQAVALASDDNAYKQAWNVIRQGLGTTGARMTWAAADKLRRLRNEPADKQQPGQQQPEQSAPTVDRANENYQKWMEARAQLEKLRADVSSMSPGAREVYLENREPEILERIKRYENYLR